MKPSDMKADPPQLLAWAHCRLFTFICVYMRLIIVPGGIACPSLRVVVARRMQPRKVDLFSRSRFSSHEGRLTPPIKSSSGREAGGSEAEAISSMTICGRTGCSPPSHRRLSEGQLEPTTKWS